MVCRRRRASWHCEVQQGGSGVRGDDDSGAHGLLRLPTESALLLDSAAVAPPPSLRAPVATVPALALLAPAAPATAIAGRLPPSPGSLAAPIDATRLLLKSLLLEVAADCAPTFNIITE